MRPTPHTAPARARFTVGQSLTLACHAWRAWHPRQHLTAILAAIVIGAVVGLATVLIPNALFGRDIPPVWWNYPVWLSTSALSGLLAATYLRTPTHQSKEHDRPDDPTGEERRTSRMGILGMLLAWFAVGCPVCNKIALLTLGYTGAITWFAPLQPVLALGSVLLLTAALIWRLRGQLACPRPIDPSRSPRRRKP